MHNLLMPILNFIVVMTFLLWMIPNSKIKAISRFFETVLPRLHIAAILRTIHEIKKKNKKAA